MIVLGRFDAEAVLRLIDTHRVTSTVLVPTHMQRLLTLPQATHALEDIAQFLKSKIGSLASQPGITTNLTPADQKQVSFPSPVASLRERREKRRGGEIDQ